MNLRTTRLVDLLQAPTPSQNSRCHKCRLTRSIGTACKDNQSPILPSTCTNQLPRDGNPRQTPKAHKRIARRVIPPVVFDFTQLRYAYGRQRDPRAAGKSEDQREDDDERDIPAGGEPQRQNGDEAQENRADHCIEVAEFVCDQAGEIPAETGPDVQERKELVGECSVDASLDRVGGEVAERDEEAPFHEEDAQSREGEDRVSEDSKIRENGFLRGLLGGKAGFDAQVRHDEEDEVNQGEDAGGPGPADAWKEGLQC